MFAHTNKHLLVWWQTNRIVVGWAPTYHQTPSPLVNIINLCKVDVANKTMMMMMPTVQFHPPYLNIQIILKTETKPPNGYWQNIRVGCESFGTIKSICQVEHVIFTSGTCHCPISLDHLRCANDGFTLNSQSLSLSFMLCQWTRHKFEFGYPKTSVCVYINVSTFQFVYEHRRVATRKLVY